MATTLPCGLTISKHLQCEIQRKFEENIYISIRMQHFQNLGCICNQECRSWRLIENALIFFSIFSNPSLSKCDSDKNVAGILIDLYIVTNYFSGPVSRNHCILQNVNDICVRIVLFCLATCVAKCHERNMRYSIEERIYLCSCKETTNFKFWNGPVCFSAAGETDKTAAEPL